MEQLENELPPSVSFDFVSFLSVVVFFLSFFRPFFVPLSFDL